MPDTLKFDILSTPKGTSPGREPPPGEEMARVTESRLVSAQETSTLPGARRERTSPGRRHPDPGFKDFPRFSYPESYRDHVYRDLSKAAKKIFLLITVRKYPLPSSRFDRFAFIQCQINILLSLQVYASI